VARGVSLVWVRIGAEGSRLVTRDGSTRLPSTPAQVVDVTGAGDAMLAAFCHGVLSGDDPITAARLGHAAAALTVASPLTVRPDLKEELR
jgi:pseudouridine kinase